jgi:hypothetical protein
VHGAPIGAEAGGAAGGRGVLRPRGRQPGGAARYLPATGVGGDDGLTTIRKCRGISVSSYHERSHDLPPTRICPAARDLPAGAAERHRAAPNSLRSMIRPLCAVLWLLAGVVAPTQRWRGGAGCCVAAVLAVSIPGAGRGAAGAAAAQAAAHAAPADGRERAQATGGAAGREIDEATLALG